MAYMPKNGGQEEENSDQRDESEVRHLIKRLSDIFFLSLLYIWRNVNYWRVKYNHRRSCGFER